MKAICILALCLLSACSSGPYVPESKQVHWTPAMIAEQHRGIAAAERYEQAHPTPTPHIAGGIEYQDPEEQAREDISAIRDDLDQIVINQE